MARSYYGAGPRRTVTVIDTVNPIAPENLGGDAITTQPPGVMQTDGASMLIIDVNVSGQAGAGSITVLAWDAVLRLWVPDSAASVVAAANGLQRFKILNWCSRFAFVFVNTISGTYDIALQALFQSS